LLNEYWGEPAHDLNGARYPRPSQLVDQLDTTSAAKGNVDEDQVRLCTLARAQHLGKVVKDRHADAKPLQDRRYLAPHARLAVHQIAERAGLLSARRGKRRRFSRALPDIRRSNL